MNSTLESRPTPDTSSFSVEQKEFLAGLMEGIAQRQLYPYLGVMEDSGEFTSDPANGGNNLAAPSSEMMIHGTPLSEVTKQELWKHELHGLDAWDRLLQHAQENKLPDEADTFRFRYHGLFHVSPAQTSLMLRCRIPAGELTSIQMRGMADIAEQWGNGKSAITTRSNLQVREIAPKDCISVLTRLASIGLTSKGSGVDNVRNITASPTAGIDMQEFIDTRPYAHALHHYILNHRDLFDLPRKFNVAYEGGGAIDTVADTNDIGFMAVKILSEKVGASISANDPVTLKPGVYFRVELCGITGHKQFASDCGVIIQPGDSLAVAAAILRVFSEHGDRTDRKKARLKYLVDRWGVERFLTEVQKKLGFPLVKLSPEECEKRKPAIQHGHIGVYRQVQPSKNYLGVVVPVGILTVKQMRRLAGLAEHYGSGQLRLTPWQNVIIPDISDAFVETVKRQLVRIGLHYEATNIMGGLVACTGNKGCKWSSTDTKGQAMALGEHLNRTVSLDQPINIHLTGCPNSCAQHYMGDIGMQGVKVSMGGQSVEGYNIVFGGGYGHQQAVAKQVFTGIAFSEIPNLMEKVLRVYLNRRNPGETFAGFSRRHDVKTLQEMFGE